ncbi:MAG: hypothetical protein ACRKGH_09705 [Dehalogenimonas sp.]
MSEIIIESDRILLSKLFSEKPLFISDIIWVYEKMDQDMVLIPPVPLMRHHKVVICSFNPDDMKLHFDEVPINHSQCADSIKAIAQVAPWAEIGWDEGKAKQLKKAPEAFVTQVIKRRNVIIEQFNKIANQQPAA